MLNLKKPPEQTPQQTTTTQDPTPEPANQNQPAAEPISTINMGPEPGADQQQAEPSVPGEANDQAGEGFQTKDQFFGWFKMGISSPNMVLSTKGVEPLTSLQIDDSDMSARACSDALYDMAMDTVWLHWMIKDDHGWMQKAGPIVFFAWMKFLAVKAELNGRQDIADANAKAAKEAAQTIRQANDPKDDEPPEEKIDEGPGEDQGVEVVEAKPRKKK